MERGVECGEGKGGKGRREKRVGPMLIESTDQVCQVEPIVWRSTSRSSRSKFSKVELIVLWSTNRHFLLFIHVNYDIRSY